MTTTSETLWAGIPVVALRGQTSVARTGASILEKTGIPELICEDETEYLEKAVNLAKDKGHLLNINNKVQELFRESPVCDAEKHARQIEEAYLDMWQKHQKL